MGMRSGHQQAAELMAEKWASTPEGRDRLGNAYLMQRDSRLEKTTRIFGQPYGGWTMGQLYSLYTLAMLDMGGHLLATNFRLGETPSRDADRSKNQQALNRLPKGVEAVVDPSQRNGDFDGDFAWSIDLPAIQFYGDGQNNSISCEDGSSWAPLEIGYTDASRTLLHLAQFHTVARWPYGDEYLTLLVLTPWDAIDAWRHPDTAPNEVLQDAGEFSNIVASYRMFGWRATR